VTTSDNRRWALFGPLAVALWVIGIFLITKNGPTDHATGGVILAWYKAHSDSVSLGAWLFMIGCLCFVILVAGLRVRLVEAVGRTSQLPMLALVGAAMAGLAGMLTAGVDLTGGIDKNDIDPGTASVLHHSVDLFFVGAELAAILPLVAFAIVAWRTRILPRWWAAFAGLVAVVLAAGPIGWLGLIFGVPLWTLGTSLFVLLRSPERMRTAAAAA